MTAVGAAKLGDALSGTGPFPVFAPTDAAVAALPAGTLTGLLANIPALTNVLTYHVLGSRALSTDIARLTTATTLQGHTVKITARPGSIQVNEATVVAPDIKGTNAVLHVGLLIPPR